MAQILSIETSTDVCGAALLQDGRLLAETMINRPRVHAERLTSALANVLDDGAVDLPSIDALAVSSGPGSYTGLRIGVSVVKGLAYAHDLPIIGVPSLEVVAAEAAACARSGDHICVMRDARRDEIYCSVFEVLPGDASGILACTVPPTVTTYDELDEFLETVSDGDVWFAGNARHAAGENIRSSVKIYESTRPVPTAYWVGRSALQRLEAGSFENLESFEPEYIRPFHTHERKPLFEGLSSAS